MQSRAESHEGNGHGHGSKGSYGRLGIALLLSFLAMYPLTMIFVNERSHFHFNLSNAYMAVIMVAPMGLIMMGVMRQMFPNRKLNIGLIAGFIALFVIALLMGRSQAGVGNDQFLRAMIPHHSRAILVCENATITDPAIEELCGQIVTAQEQEIATMEAMLDD